MRFKFKRRTFSLYSPMMLAHNVLLQALSLILTDERLATIRYPYLGPFSVHGVYAWR